MARIDQTTLRWSSSSSLTAAGQLRAGGTGSVRTVLDEITARTLSGVLIGFVNVAWDGGDHAFLIDTKTSGSWQRRGLGSEIVRQAAHHAKTAGCMWLHVDFRSELRPFYLDACGSNRPELD